MENVSLNMDGYFRRLKRFLNCPKSVRKPFLDRTRQMAEDFILENPTATSQNVADFLGEPRELAQEFLETLEPDVLEHYHRQKKLLLCGCIVSLIVSLIIVTVFGIYFQKVPCDLEVTETVVIYSDSMEKVK